MNSSNISSFHTHVRLPAVILGEGSLIEPQTQPDKYCPQWPLFTDAVRKRRALMLADRLSGGFRKTPQMR